MSKTVLLSDELHKNIQDSKIEMNWVEVEISLAKKIELFFDFYMLKVFLQKSPHITNVDLVNSEKESIH